MCIVVVLVKLMHLQGVVYIRRVYSVKKHNISNEIEESD